MTPAAPTIVTLGDNATSIWGMSNTERARRMAKAGKLPFGDIAPDAGAALLVNLAFAFDPAWLAFMRERPGLILTLGGRAVLGHVDDRHSADRADVVASMRENRMLPPLSAAETRAVEDGIELHNAQLRKRERPFILPLDSTTVRAVERASYVGAYKGVTDLLTKYLWPELALHLTRLAAWLGLSPNGVTAIGALLCVAATFAFFDGRYWLGLALGFGFMVLDTVDGKLARCTLTSSWWGNIFDHGIDIVHPPFWWWAWGAGLAAYGRALPGETFMLALGTIVGGYVLQRAIEGRFMRSFGMHIHVWQKIDSQFRLITARRNPNMVILFLSLLAGRPDLGFVAVAWWTVASLVFHLVRLVQASAVRARGQPILSWLA